MKIEKLGTCNNPRHRTLHTKSWACQNWSKPAIIMPELDRKGIETGLLKMDCGECGGNFFKIYKRKKTTELVVECNKCKGTSVITWNTPEIKIEWGSGDGLLTVATDQ